MNIEEIKYIGPKTKKLLNTLNIFSIDDLITFYPYRYEVIKKTNITDIKDNEKIVVDGYLEENAKLVKYNNTIDKITFRINTSTNLYNIVIFNRGYLKDKLLLNTNVTIIGKLDLVHNTITASDIKFGLIEDKTIITPIYHTVNKLTSKNINDCVNLSYNYIKEVKDYLPEEIINKYNFIDKLSSIKELHNPTSTNNYKKSLSRIKYEELFLFMLRVNYLKQKRKSIEGIKREVDKNEIDNLIRNLSFKLTPDQLKAVEEIYNDLISIYKMNRILIGDVGSGKTIVAFIALYINYLSGYQGVMMVPTEILAKQHLVNLKHLFDELGIVTVLLTGKLKSSEKKEIYNRIENGLVDIVIGTHAVFQESLNYKNLGLVITDEQHRFGVNQRNNLKSKGKTPDVLYMSATPIPRTYALTIYGDMEVSTIKTIPSERKQIITKVYEEDKIKDVLFKMYNELLQNHQIYVVAPLIEETENNNSQNVINLEEKMNKAFKNKYKIGVLHGKMKENEKDEIMDKFKSNEIQILISTTVIEVGVDVKNATMIVIFEANKFGLSALHQLRGRVGRSNLQSYCLLISNIKNERLQILEKESDGFIISEEDFKLRGSGEIFGLKQSGEMQFKLANINKDYNILLKAKEDSQNYLESNKISKSLIELLTNSTNLT